MLSKAQPLPKAVRFRELLLVLALGLAGVWLRVHRVAQWPLNGDEIYTVWTAEAMLRPAEELSASRRWQRDWAWATHPLLQAVTGVVFQCAGSSPLSARLFPLASGLLAMFLLPWLMARSYGRQSGLWTLAFLATSPWHVLHSQYARYESVCYLLGGVALLSSLEFIRRGRSRDRVLSLFCGGAAIAAHLTAVLPVGCMQLCPWLRHRFVIRRPPLLLAVTLVALFVVWIFGWGVVTVFREGFDRRSAGESAFRIVASLTYNHGPLVVLLSTTALLVAVRRRDPEGITCGAVLVLPLLLLLALSSLKAVGGRFLSAATPALVVLAARWVADEARADAARRRTQVLAVLAIFLQVPILWSDLKDAQRYDYPAIASELASRMGPSDRVYCDGAGILERSLGRAAEELPNTLDELDRISQGTEPSRCFLVLLRQRGHWVFPGPPEAVARWLEQHGHCLRVAGKRRLDDPLYRFEIGLWEVRPPAR